MRGSKVESPHITCALRCCHISYHTSCSVFSNPRKANRPAYLNASLISPICFQDSNYKNTCACYRAPHTTWLRDWHCDAWVTSPCAQVFQPRNRLLGSVVKIWHVRQVLDLGRVFATAKSKVRMHQSWGSAIYSRSVRCLLARLLVSRRVVRLLSRVVYAVTQTCALQTAFDPNKVNKLKALRRVGYY